MIDRRTILRGLGGSAIALPLLEAMGDPLSGRRGPRAAAAAPLTPKRFVVHYHSAGTHLPRWRPTGGERDFTLPFILEPLEPHKADIVVLDGLVVAAGIDGKLSTLDQHGVGMGGMLTGTYVTRGNMCGLGYAQGPSVDQEIARVIGAGTRFRSLELGADKESRSGSVFGKMCYTAKNQPVPCDVDPFNVWKKLFSDLTTDPAAMTRAREQRRSVLDAAAESFRALAPRVSKTDGARLDAHFNSLRDIEKRLDALAVPTGTCAKPNPGAAFDVSKQTSFPATIRLQMDLLVMALACDLTRVASLQLGDSVFDMYYTWLGITDLWYHKLTHAGDNDGVAWDKVARIKRWHEEQFAYLLTKMKEIREGDGTLLDNTLVWSTSELGKGNNHTFANAPFVLAGRAGGALRTGRYLAYAPAAKTLHNGLLISLLNLFGVPATTFGHEPWCNGPLPRLD
jgi:hypothetical protein